ncbi:unnamed protein product [Toxocara canis]|uniref:TAFH domain-containing protein n=1 Tax=Toxocara canis TaxID=6265 RepID=A0A183UH71_TOXCA|nr:unnamed protein product [Toxocara canis]
MSARFGLIRNFLFNWPLVSALVMFSVTFSLGISIVALYWALRGLAVYFKRCDETHIEQYEVRSGRASSADLSSGFHSYGSMDNLYEKEADSVFKSGYALKDATVRRAESQRVAAGEPSVWELLRKRKAPSDVDLGKRLPGTKGVAGWDMKSEATPEELAEFLKSLMKSSPQNLSNDVAKIIQSLIDGSLSAATVTVRLRKLVDLGDYPNFSAVLRRSLPALQESVRKGEVTMEGIRPLEVGAEIEQKTPRGERKVSESITTPLSTSSVNQSRTETVERRHSEPSDDELPECPVLTGIPGWDVVPEPILRRRLVHKRNSFSLT